MKQNFDWLEASVILVSLLVSIGVGTYFGLTRQKKNDVSDYFFGDGRMALFPVTASLAASFISGVTMLGQTNEVYMYGTQAMMTMAGKICIAFCTAVFFLPVLYKVRVQSLYEYHELRFAPCVRVIVSVIYTISLLGFMPTVIYSTALTVGQVTGIHHRIISVVMGLICTIYTTIGGFRAVVWSDTLQGLVMLMSVATILIFGFMRVGSLSTVFETVKTGGRLEFFNLNLDPTVRATMIPVILSGFVDFFGTNYVSPSAVQRYISVQSLSKARKAILWLTVSFIFFESLCGLTGMLIYTAYSQCDPVKSGKISSFDEITPFFVLDVMGHVRSLPGLFTAGLVCGALSTMSTDFNTAGLTLFKDLIEPTFKKRLTNERRVVSGLVLVSGVVFTSIAIFLDRIGSILEILITLSGITDGAMAGVLMLGMFFPVANTKGALWGGVVSLIFMGITVSGSMYHRAAGHLIYDLKPFSIDSCGNTTVSVNSTVFIFQDTPSDRYVFPLFKLSFFYFMPLGLLTTVTVGLIVSVFTGGCPDLDLDLVTPFVRKYVDKRRRMNYRAVALKERQNVSERKENIANKDDIY